MSAQKNKTLATLLALVAGAVGAHRFYLAGARDRYGLLHLATLPLSGLLWSLAPDAPGLFVASPLVLSMLAGVLAALVIGLTPDEKWDARYPQSAPSRSGWPLAILLVLAVGTGSIGLIWTIARTFDLLFTGGAYG